MDSEDEEPMEISGDETTKNDPLSSDTHSVISGFKGFGLFSQAACRLKNFATSPKSVIMEDEPHRSENIENQMGHAQNTFSPMDSGGDINFRSLTLGNLAMSKQGDRGRSSPIDDNSHVPNINPQVTSSQFCRKENSPPNKVRYRKAPTIRSLGKKGATEDSGGVNSGIHPKEIYKPSKKRCCSLKRLIVTNVLLCCIAALMVYVFSLSNPNYQQQISDLSLKLEEDVLGQDIALKLVIDSLKDQFADKDVKSEQSAIKVFSFHGWTGVGKNYVSSHIMDAFTWKKVTKFIIPLHFPHSRLDNVYAKQIPDWTAGNVTQDRVNIFLFDEMDKASPGVISGLLNSLEKLKNLSHSDGTYIVFLLLSNTKGTVINQEMVNLVQSGKKRNSLSPDSFINILQSDSKGSWLDSLLARNFIDVLVPFLPLDKTHVRQCIERDLRQKGFFVSKDIVEEIAEELSFISDMQLSVTGCKRVSDKVDYVVH